MILIRNVRLILKDGINKIGSSLKQRCNLNMFKDSKDGASKKLKLILMILFNNFYHK